MLEEPDWSQIFAPNGRLLEEGELIRRTNLSRTLQTIADEGPNAFYTVIRFHIDMHYMYSSYYLRDQSQTQ